MAVTDSELFASSSKGSWSSFVDTGDETSSSFIHGCCTCPSSKGGSFAELAILRLAESSLPSSCDGSREGLVNEASDERESFESSFRTLGLDPDGFLGGGRELM